MINLPELQVKLKECSLYGLLLVTQVALTRAGYGDVQFQDRRESRQKTRHGGHELLCRMQVGEVTSHIVVKVIKDGIRTRMLDEAMGTADRRRADFAMIVSPHNLSPKVAPKQAEYTKTPLQVFAGMGLAALVAKYGVGIRNNGSIDYAYYEVMKHEADELIPQLLREWI